MNLFLLQSSTASLSSANVSVSSSSSESNHFTNYHNCRPTLTNSTVTSLSLSLDANSVDTANSNLISTRNDLESLLNSDMFNNLYNLFETNTISVANDSDTESDDSFAAGFSECIRKLTVYSSKDKNQIFQINDGKVLQGGGLFRIVVLRNVIQDQFYAFLILVKDFNELIDERNNFDDAIRNDEIFLWWR